MSDDLIRRVWLARRAKNGDASAQRELNAWGLPAGPHPKLWVCSTCLQQEARVRYYVCRVCGGEVLYTGPDPNPGIQPASTLLGDIVADIDDRLTGITGWVMRMLNRLLR